jgi:hypothetical protein
MKAIRSIQYSAAHAIESASAKPERERDESQGELVQFLRGQVLFCKYRIKGRSTAYRIDDVIWLPDADRQQVWDPEKKDWMPMYTIFGAHGLSLHMLVHTVAPGSERLEPIAWAGPANRKDRQRVLMPAQHSFFSGVRYDLCHHGVQSFSSVVINYGKEVYQFVLNPLYAAALLPALVLDLRYASAFDCLETRLGVTFGNKVLLKSAFMESGSHEMYGGYGEVRVQVQLYCCFGTLYKF